MSGEPDEIFWTEKANNVESSAKKATSESEISSLEIEAESFVLTDTATQKIEKDKPKTNGLDRFILGDKSHNSTPDLLLPQQGSSQVWTGSACPKKMVTIDQKQVWTGSACPKKMVIVDHALETKLNSSTVNYAVKIDETEIVTESVKNVASSDRTVVKSDSSPSLKSLD